MTNLTMVWLVAAATARRRRMSLLAFAAAAAGFHGLVAASFPAIGGMAAVESVVTTFPAGLRTLLRLAPGLQAGFGLRDYLAFSWFHPVFLGLGTALVVARAADALAGEIASGAIYLLLSRPIPRWAFVVGKVLEMGWSAAIFCLAAWLGLALGVWIGSLPTLTLGRFVPAATIAWLLFLALGTAALVISSLSSRAAAAAGLATALALILFVLDVIPALFNSPAALFNPWHHYFPQVIVATGRVALPDVVVLVGWIVVGTIGAATFFARRDLV